MPAKWFLWFAQTPDIPLTTKQAECCICSNRNPCHPQYSHSIWELRTSICNVSPAMKQFPNFSLNTQSCCKAQGSWDEYRIAAWNLLWQQREETTQWTASFTLKLLHMGFLESSLYLQNPGLICNNLTALLKWSTDELSLTFILQNLFRHSSKLSWS